MRKNPRLVGAGFPATAREGHRPSASWLDAIRSERSSTGFVRSPGPSGSTSLSSATTRHGRELSPSSSSSSRQLAAPALISGGLSLSVSSQCATLFTSTELAWRWALRRGPSCSPDRLDSTCVRKTSSPAAARSSTSTSTGSSTTGSTVRDWAAAAAAADTNGLQGAPKSSSTFARSSRAATEHVPGTREPRIVEFEPVDRCGPGLVVCRLEFSS